MSHAFSLTDGGVRELDEPDAVGPAAPSWRAVVLPESDADARAELVRALRDAGIADADDLAARALEPRQHATSAVGDVVVLHVPVLRFDAARDAMHRSEVVTLCTRDVIVTASRSRDVSERLVERLRHAPSGHGGGTHWVLRHVIAYAADAASAAEEDVDARTAALEREVFTEQHDDPVAALYRVKRAIASGRRVLDPLVTRIELLVDDEDLADRLPDGAEQGLRKLGSALARVSAALDSDDRLLGDMLTAHLTLVQVQQNEDMRKISAYAALITVPTLIAGIYGMNFRHMPELGWTFGYPLAILAMAAVVLGLRHWFRRSGWL